VCYAKPCRISRHPITFGSWSILPPGLFRITLPSSPKSKSMALITCPACTGKLSSAARACPRCGHPGPFGEAPAAPWSQGSAYPSPAQPDARYESPGAYPPPRYEQPGDPYASQTVAYAPAPAAPPELECPFCRVRQTKRTCCPLCEERLVEPRFLAPHHFPRTPVSYSSFGQRLAAYLIDGLVLLPVTGLVWWLQTRSPAGMVIGALLALVVPAAYHIVLIATTGQTLGKRVAEIQVRMADGRKAGWGAAFLRFLPLLLLGVVGFLAMLVLAARVTQPDLDGFYTFWSRVAFVNGAMPIWAKASNAFFSLYALADIITFFANDRRRAVHDFIAGTVVVYN
jgi:uncharacterized RDD family membrane protein YckC